MAIAMTGKIALVTGAGSGFGRAVSLALHEEGVYSPSLTAVSETFQITNRCAHHSPYWSLAVSAVPKPQDYRRGSALQALRKKRSQLPCMMASMSTSWYPLMRNNPGIF